MSDYKPPCYSCHYREAECKKNEKEELSEKEQQIICRNCDSNHWTSKCDLKELKERKHNFDVTYGRHVPPTPEQVKKEIAAEDDIRQREWIQFVREEWRNTDAQERMLMIESMRTVKVPKREWRAEKRHLDIQCQSCGYMLGDGMRWKCEQCKDFNLCGVCEKKRKDEKHCEGKHTFTKILDSRKFRD